MCKTTKTTLSDIESLLFILMNTSIEVHHCCCVVADIVIDEISDSIDDIVLFGNLKDNIRDIIAGVFIEDFANCQQSCF